MHKRCTRQTAKPRAERPEVWRLLQRHRLNGCKNENFGRNRRRRFRVSRDCDVARHSSGRGVLLCSERAAVVEAAEGKGFDGWADFYTAGIAGGAEANCLIGFGVGHDAVERYAGGAGLVDIEIREGDVFVDADRGEAACDGDGDEIVELGVC